MGKEHLEHKALEIRVIRRKDIRTYRDAMKFARQCMTNHEGLKILLEQAIARHEIVGSYSAIQYGEASGKASALYISDIPWWYQEKESLEHDIKELRLHVQPIVDLITDIKEYEPELFLIYKIKYSPPLSWEQARYKAWDDHKISERRFRTVEAQLTRKAALYLGLCRFVVYTPPEGVTESVIENQKKAVKV